MREKDAIQTPELVSFQLMFSLKTQITRFLDSCLPLGRSNDGAFSLFLQFPDAPRWVYFLSLLPAPACTCMHQRLPAHK